MQTKTQIRKSLLFLDLLDEAIKEAGSDGIPSGHLYAMLMEQIDLCMYQAAIDILIQAKRITSTNHLLKSL